MLSPEAEKEVEQILRDVSNFTGFWTSAVSLWQDLNEKFDLIAYMPTIGKRRDNERFETFCRNYRIIYRLYGDDVYILTVIHSSRLYPRLENS
ncbi:MULTISPECIES: type II toxin-antitoxin system RelE/ParE family toxin [unclassified Mannheimia]|uniref:type II toxin-antitoxin system RelE/ParE family toxin n=1 Tax=unclassified Mannheimia TaxID=2645054 RepID=UPI00359CD13D